MVASLTQTSGGRDYYRARRINSCYIADMHSRFAALAVTFLALAGLAGAQQDRDFSGSWKLDRAHSTNLGATYLDAEPALRVDQNSTTLSVTADTSNDG